jgi:uncharacterized oxidoreductase
MPNVTAERLTEIEIGLLIAAGASAEEADIIARYNVGANLVGHDSHGIILIPQYIDRIKAGHIVPGAPWEIQQETATTTVIDGNWGFGYVVNDRAMRYTIEKAKKAERRSCHRAPSKPYRAVGELSAAGVCGGHDCDDHC